MLLSSGGSPAQTEAMRMVSEKFAAGDAAARALMRG